MATLEASDVPGKRPGDIYRGLRVLYQDLRNRTRIGAVEAPKVWVALRPPGSVAVTVMVALPGASPITLRSETLAVATLEASEAAPYLRASPSGSKRPRRCLPVPPCSLPRPGPESHPTP